jgi:SAM-dependent methyltransferase
MGGASAEAGSPRGFAHEPLYARVQQLLAVRPGPLRILDIPAGHGVLSARLVAAGHAVTAVELAAERFAVPGIACVSANMEERLPFADGAFDALVSLEGIEHLRNPYAFIGECRRILTAGGWLIVSTPNILKLTSRLRFLAGGFLNSFPRPLNEHRERHGMYGHISLMSYYEMRFLLRSEGFRVLQATTSRRKPGDWLAAPLVPWIAVATWMSLAGERDAHQRESNREIARHVLSADLLFGKHLILVAERVGG